MPTPRRAVDYRVDPFDLQLLVAVLAHGSITAAAQAMHLSLAAVSARLKALEHQVGTTLLQRAKTGTTATDAGRALARQAHRVLAELDALHIEMSAFGQGLRGSVRLLCNTAAMSEALPPRIGRFLVAHPDIDLQLQELSSSGVLAALHQGMADVGIVANHVDTAGLSTLPWLDDALVALRPATHQGQPAAAMCFAQLLDQPFVGLSADAGLSGFLLQQAARSGRVPRHRVRVSNFDAMACMVDAGVGVGVMPRSAAQRWQHARVQTVQLQDAWAQRTLLICHTAQASALPGVRALIAALLAASQPPAAVSAARGLAA